MNIEALYELYKQHYSVCTDTRKIKNGDIFFALKGENFNGNKFARQALDAGAIAVVVDEPLDFSDDRVFTCNNVLETLQALAKHHRMQFDMPVIGITGSNGKTTTKELVHAVLSSSFKTYTTVGNLNNHIGIPLTILSILPDAQIAIIEMGANHQKEIASYCTYAMPTHGLITNCGKAHLEGFGGVMGVRKGKGELYDYLRDNDGTALVMWDYDYLREMSKGISEIFTYGSENAEVIGKIISKDDGGFLSVDIVSNPEIGVIQTNLVGNYNFPNVMAAVAFGIYAYVEPHLIKQAIENYKPENSRSQAKQIGSNSFILDAYNANPSSMKLAIENFAQAGGDKILLLGAMKEMGEYANEEHQQIINLIDQYKWHDVVLVGYEFAGLKHNYQQFDNATQANEYLKTKNYQNKSFLVKGSRGYKMEESIKDI